MIQGTVGFLVWPCAGMPYPSNISPNSTFRRKNNSCEPFWWCKVTERSTPPRLTLNLLYKAVSSTQRSTLEGIVLIVGWWTCIFHFGLPESVTSSVLTPHLLQHKLLTFEHNTCLPSCCWQSALLIGGCSWRKTFTLRPLGLGSPTI